MTARWRRHKLTAQIISTSLIAWNHERLPAPLMLSHSSDTPLFEERSVDAIADYAVELAALCTQIMVDVMPRQDILSEAYNSTRTSCSNDPGRAVAILFERSQKVCDFSLAWSVYGLAMIPGLQADLAEHIGNKLLNTTAPLSTVVRFIENNLKFVVPDLTKQKVVDDLHIEEYRQQKRTWGGASAGSPASSAAIEVMKLIRSKWINGDYRVPTNQDGVWTERLSSVIDRLAQQAETMSDRFQGSIERAGRETDIQRPPVSRNSGAAEVSDEGVLNVQPAGLPTHRGEPTSAAAETDIPEADIPERAFSRRGH